MLKNKNKIFTCTQWSNYVLEYRVCTPFCCRPLFIYRYSTNTVSFIMWEGTPTGLFTDFKKPPPFPPPPRYEPSYFFVKKNSDSFNWTTFHSSNWRIIVFLPIFSGLKFHKLFITKLPLQKRFNNDILTWVINCFLPS